MLSSWLHFPFVACVTRLPWENDQEGGHLKKASNLASWQCTRTQLFCIVNPPSLNMFGIDQRNDLLRLFFSSMSAKTVLSFPGGTSGKESTCQARRCRRCGFNPWVRKIPWRRKWQPTPVFLPGKFHGQRSLTDYSPWDCKESDMAKQLNTHTQGQYYRNTEDPDFLPFIALHKPVHL